MSKRGIRILSVVAGGLCALALLGYSMLNLAANALLGGPKNANLDGIEAFQAHYGNEPAKVILGEQEGRAGGKPARERTNIELLFVPPEASLIGVRAEGLDIRTVERYDMAYLTRRPYDGYLVEISGHATGTGELSLRLGDQPIDLAKSSEYGGLFQNLGKRGQFYQPRRSIEKSLGEPPPRSLARTFLPTRGERVEHVAATGRPAFEEDFYQGGVWLGTYAVYRSKAEAQAAAVEKA